MKTRVLITGGNGDIAQAIAIELAKYEDFDIATPAKEELDVTDVESVRAYVSNFVPDILINNAGYIKIIPISDDNMDSEKKSIDINLFGVFNCTGATLKRNKDALIINIGSSAGTKIHGEWSSYCATKAAVITATKCWALEGVRAICLSPGRAITKMRKSMYPNEDPKTLMDPKDFAKIVLKAINDEYEYGINLDVNVNNVKEMING